MKKIIFLLMTAMSVATVTFAQAPQTGSQRPQLTPEERAKKTTDRLNAQVQLTPEQYTKVLEVNKDFMTQREALGQGQLTDDQRAKMRELSKQRDTKLKAILTPEQWEKSHQHGTNTMSPAKQ